MLFSLRLVITESEKKVALVKDHVVFFFCFFWLLFSFLVKTHWFGGGTNKTFDANNSDILAVPSAGASFLFMVIWSTTNCISSSRNCCFSARAQLDYWISYLWMFCDYLNSSSLLGNIDVKTSPPYDMNLHVSASLRVKVTHQSFSAEAFQWWSAKLYLGNGFKSILSVVNNLSLNGVVFFYYMLSILGS